VKIPQETHTRGATFRLSFSLRGSANISIAQSTPPQNVSSQAQQRASLLARRYRLGEKLHYHMRATNRDRAGTRVYEAQADGTVKQNSEGKFYEDYQWSGLMVNGNAVSLLATNTEFHQLRPLDPACEAPFPRPVPYLPRPHRPGLGLREFLRGPGLGDPAKRIEPCRTERQIRGRRAQIC
jgi:hypothetical protein